MEMGRIGGNRSLPGSSDPHVQEVMRAAHDELRQLMRQRADDHEAHRDGEANDCGTGQSLRRRRSDEELLELVDRKSGGRQPGFTKACRMVLMEADRRWARAKCVSRFSSAFRRCCCVTKIRWPQ